MGEKLLPCYLASAWCHFCLPVLLQRLLRFPCSLAEAPGRPSLCFRGTGHIKMAALPVSLFPTGDLVNPSTQIIQAHLARGHVIPSNQRWPWSTSDPPPCDSPRLAPPILPYASKKSQPPARPPTQKRANAGCKMLIQICGKFLQL